MADRMQLGLIGRNIQSSLSPALHEDAMQAAGLSGTYRLIDLDLHGGNLRDAVRKAIDDGLTGFNVTFPCKQDIIPLLDNISPEARKIGAVNTVVIQADGRLHGYNTDSIGFVRNFEEALGRPAASGAAVALVGAGGAGRAVAFALMELGVAELLIHDTDVPRASQLLSDIEKHFDRRARVIEQLDGSISGLAGVVNATPVGMRGIPGLPVPHHLIGAQQWVAEVVYTPIDTEFLKAAKAKGIAAVDGGGMCVHQAAEAFKLFAGCRPDVERMRRLFLESIGES